MGIPTVTIATSEFIGLARASMASFGFTDMSFVVVPHPLGMIPKEEVEAKAEAAFPEILKAATQWKPAVTASSVGKKPYPAEHIKFTGTVEDVNNLFFKQGWSLGIPIIPPTPERVAAMLKGTSHRPDEVVWEAVPPRMGTLTVELVATLGAMAGCKPEYMPLMLAIVEAMSNEAYSWRSQTTTTHPAAPLVIVNGPIRDELGIAYSTGCLGPEQYANVTIGHFINLVGDVVGGSVPPDADKTTQGWPGNIVAAVTGENEEQSPWGSYAVEKGFKPTDNVVTLIGGGPPDINNDHSSVTGKDLLENISSDMIGQAFSCFDDNPMYILLSPEHAATIARDFPTKEEVRKFLWEQAKIPFRKFMGWVDGKPVPVFSCNPPPEAGKYDDDTLLPVLKNPDKIEIFVVGGPGKQSQTWSGQFACPPVSVLVDKWR